MTDSIDLDLSPLAEKGERPPVRSLGGLALDFIEEGGPPPVPRPTVGLVDGTDLPLFYPGLNAVAGPAGTGKSLLMKHLVRQQVRAGRDVLVLDCETSAVEYAATLVGDLGLSAVEMERVHYVTDSQSREPHQDRWSGRVDRLGEALGELDALAPSLVVIDSQSKAMAQMGLDEVRPIDCAGWYEKVAEPIADYWPQAALVMIQGRQKGWAVGMDVRQGRGSSSQLHEVTAQYMMWPKTPGSRTVDGQAKLVCTKCRYGHRAEGSLAAVWLYGPSGFALNAPEVYQPPTEDEVQAAWWKYLGDQPEPPRQAEAIEAVAAQLGSADSGLVARVLDALVARGEVERRQWAPPGKPGRKPFHVWPADSEWPG